MTFFTVDGHLDLAYNVINFGRDLRRPLDDIRRADARGPLLNGIATVSIPALLAGGVRLAIGSLFAMPLSRRTENYVSRVTYDDRLTWPQRQAAAHAVAMAQRDTYRRLADQDDRVMLVQSAADLDALLALDATDEPKLGILMSMEGADPIREPEEVELWYELGLRAVGPAWDDTRYAPGQWNGGGKLPAAGHRLLEQMAAFNMVLDITHMSEEATLQAFEAYPGPVVASHCNTRKLVPMARQLSDDQIRLLAERDGVIGVVLFNRFLRDGHMKGDPKPLVTLAHVLAHIDHICQLTGSAEYVAIGTDFDGGFGALDIPDPLDSAADLPKLADALRDYGYDDDAVAAVMGHNWLRVLRRALP